MGSSEVHMVSAEYWFSCGKTYAITTSNSLGYWRDHKWITMMWPQEIGELRGELATLVREKRWVELDVLLALIGARHG